MLKSKLRRSVSLVVAVAIGSVLATAPGASAATWEIDYANWDEVQIPNVWFRCDITADVSWGKGCYNTNDDNLKVEDEASDGRRVAVHWQLKPDSVISRAGLCIETGGRYSVGACDKSFSNEAVVRVRVGRCNGSLFNCESTGVYDWSGWTAWKRAG